MLNEDARPTAFAVRSRRGGGASSNKGMNRTRNSATFIRELEGLVGCVRAGYPRR